MRSDPHGSRSGHDDSPHGEHSRGHNLHAPPHVSASEATISKTDTLMTMPMGFIRRIRLRSLRANDHNQPLMGAEARSERRRREAAWWISI
jgi:hypothetical protein